MAEPLTPSWIAGPIWERDGAKSIMDDFEARIARLHEREPVLMAFVSLAQDAACDAALQSRQRWGDGQPLSPLDGMPVAIKDVIETADMPTSQGSPLWEGFHTGNDAACVQALREAGAIILGKTTTTEFAASEPFHATTNPHDPARTPGGSSSGSAAAVGAGIVPAALGTQVMGSILRPASFCGCVGYKPSFGALNRGGCNDHASQSCLGVLASSVDLAWGVAAQICARVGGDPGYTALAGPLALTDSRRPVRYAVLETEGWKRASEEARDAFARQLKRLADRGIEIVPARNEPRLNDFEDAVADASAISAELLAWEHRWPQAGYARRQPALLSEAIRRRVAGSAAMTLDDYRRALGRRQAIRARFEVLVQGFDGFVALAATGAAPRGLKSTGDTAMNVPASLLGVPAVSLPMLRDDGLPLGLQVIGRPEEDYDLMRGAKWIMENAGP